MMYTFDILEPGPDQNAALDGLTRIFAPLYAESWMKEKAPARGNPPYDMNVGAFASMWFANSMRIFVAYDEHREAQGYLLGMMFRPLTHNVSIFQIEDWYLRDASMTQALFDHVYSVLKYMGVDELQISWSGNERYPLPPATWKPGGNTHVDRFTKS